MHDPAAEPLDPHALPEATLPTDGKSKAAEAAAHDKLVAELHRRDRWLIPVFVVSAMSAGAALFAAGMVVGKLIGS